MSAEKEVYVQLQARQSENDPGSDVVPEAQRGASRPLGLQTQTLS